MLFPITQQQATSQLRAAAHIPVKHEEMPITAQASKKFEAWLDLELERLEETFEEFHTPEGYKTAMGR
ncbi:MAG: hypothetical protein KDA84_16170 [Planctomycetaceae bacterium]|nr:hypothetical protein [Planctomycetaceae bacterium]